MIDVTMTIDLANAIFAALGKLPSAETATIYLAFKDACEKARVHPTEVNPENKPT